MHRIAADENFNGFILRGIVSRMAGIDAVRIQDMHIKSADDDVVLEWCVKESRILLTHDEQTMGTHVKRRIDAGDKPPRVVVVDALTPIGQAIEEIVLLLECSTDEDWMCPIRRIPL